MLAVPTPSTPPSGRIRLGDWKQIPNLLSIARVVLAFPMAAGLAANSTTGTLWALALLSLAGITDALDGYLARRWKCETKLGLVLDPVADKLLASLLIVALMLYRDFPIWLACIIIGRDLAIVAAAALVLRRHHVALPSNLTGKYAFFSVVMLLGFWIIHFSFGTILFTYSTVILIGLTVISYGRALLLTLHGKPLPISRDRTAYRILRVAASFVVLVICLVMLLREKTWLLG